MGHGCWTVSLPCGAARKGRESRWSAGGCGVAPVAPIRMLGGKEGTNWMPVETRELYSSPNGDRWFLSRDAGTGRVFIRHEANVPSSGQISDIDIGAFLSRGPLNPEHQALLRLIATLVEGTAGA